ncbi:MAG: transposase [Bryobacterales bacterium]|nr:transposase [Bryobacterales bacterium]
MAHRLREAVESEDGIFLGPVELDATYLGGKRKILPEKKREKMTGRGPKGKTAVAGNMDCASNQVAARVVEFQANLTLQGFVYEHAYEGAAVYPGEARTYEGVVREHEFITHSQQEYVRGEVHTMSLNYLDLYVTKFAGRHNLSRRDKIDQMNDVVAGMTGKRHTYKRLIADNGRPLSARLGQNNIGDLR